MNRIIVIALVWLFFTCLPFGLHAQKIEKIDRLKAELAHVSSDTAEIRILLTLAMNYDGYQMDSALSYAHRITGKIEINQR